MLDFGKASATYGRGLPGQYLPYLEEEGKQVARRPENLARIPWVE